MRLNRIRDDYEASRYATTDGFESYLKQALVDMNYLIALCLAAREFVSGEAWNAIMRRADVIQNADRIIARDRRRMSPHVGREA